MVDFIVITLLFLDNNLNNQYDLWDSIINIESTKSISRNVYCKIYWNPKYELCWYSWIDNKFLDKTENDRLLSTLDWKHYIYNSEIFEKWYKRWRILYVEYDKWKYIFRQNENDLNKNNIIYSLSNDDWLFINDLYKKAFVGIFILFFLLWIWLILFPKKINKNEK